MPKPLIGITCGTSALDPSAKNLQDRLNHSYSRAVARAGGIPVVIPNATTSGHPHDLLARLDGLLLSGGYDVAPDLYGERKVNDTVEVDSERDAAEMALIPKAIEIGMPILAICRGIQVLNVALGGTLIQDIPSQVETSICHSQKADRHVAVHRVSVEAGSRLCDALGTERLDVNSFHHQALKRAAAGLRVTAAAPDGTIEGVEGIGEGFLLGVQWHPEEMLDVQEPARKLFSAFVSAAAGCSGGRG